MEWVIPTIISMDAMESIYVGLCVPGSTVNDGCMLGVDASKCDLGSFVN